MKIYWVLTLGVLASCKIGGSTTSMFGGGGGASSGKEGEAEKSFAESYGKNITEWCGEIPFTVDWASFRGHYVRDYDEAKRLEFDQEFEEGTAVTYCGGALSELMRKACFDIAKQGPTPWVPTVRARIKGMRCKYDDAPHAHKVESEGRKTRYEVTLDLTDGILTVGVYGATIDATIEDYEWEWLKAKLDIE